jgi:hypothetical protein
MSSTVCGLCNLHYHVKNYGWIWTKDAGHHRWQEPTKVQIAERLRIRYGLV